MEIAHLLLEVIILLLALYLVFFKSYMNEKGKNLATKEDIKEITDKIESVKLEYVMRNTMLNKQLEIEEKLFEFLSQVYNNIVFIISNSQVGNDVDNNWNDFISSKHEYEKLALTYGKTNLSKYSIIGSKFESVLNLLVIAYNKRDIKLVGQRCNELLMVIDEYKLEIYNQKSKLELENTTK